MPRKPTTQQAPRRLTVTLNPVHDYMLYHWTGQIPKGQIASHIKVALLEYAQRYAGQTITAPPPPPPPPEQLVVPSIEGLSAVSVPTQPAAQAAPAPAPTPQPIPAPPTLQPAPRPVPVEAAPQSPPPAAPTPTAVPMEDDPPEGDRPISAAELETMRRLQASLG